MKIMIWKQRNTINNHQIQITTTYSWRKWDFFKIVTYEVDGDWYDNL